MEPALALVYDGDRALDRVQRIGDVRAVHLDIPITVGIVQFDGANFTNIPRRHKLADGALNDSNSITRATNRTNRTFFILNIVIKVRTVSDLCSIAFNSLALDAAHLVLCNNVTRVARDLVISDAFLNT